MDIPVPTKILSAHAIAFIESPNKEAMRVELECPSTDIATLSSSGLMPASAVTKLANIASGATANQTDAFLLSLGNATGFLPANKISQFPVELCYACSNNADPITTGVNKRRFRLPYNFTLTSLYACAGVAPVGDYILINIDVADVPIINPKLRINAGASDSSNASVAYTITSPVIPAFTWVSVGFDRVGSTTPGSDILLYLSGYKS